MARWQQAALVIGPGRHRHGVWRRARAQARAHLRPGAEERQERDLKRSMQLRTEQRFSQPVLSAAIIIVMAPGLTGPPAAGCRSYKQTTRRREGRSMEDGLASLGRERRNIHAAGGDGGSGRISRELALPTTNIKSRRGSSARSPQGMQHA